VVDFSFVNKLVKDRYTPDFGRPAEKLEFMLRLCLLQYIYGDSDRQVEENARINLAYKYFLGLAVDEEPLDHSTFCAFRIHRLGEEKFRKIFKNIVRQCFDKCLVTGKRQIIDPTHIEADVARNSPIGIIKISRQNVIRDIRKQDSKFADRLVGNEQPPVKQDRFTPKEEGFAEVIKNMPDFRPAFVIISFPLGINRFYSTFVSFSSTSAKRLYSVPPKLCACSVSILA
jgi:transposase